MTREEAIEILKTDSCVDCGVGSQSPCTCTFDGYCDIKDAMEMAIKALEQKPCEDAISRKTVLLMIEDIQDAGGFIGYSTYSKAFDQVDNMPSVTPIHRDRTVQDFVDKCRECGARYGRYKDFCEFVAEMVLSDDFEDNAGANAEILCRKLSKLGIVKADEDEWVLAEMESEE